MKHDMYERGERNMKKISSILVISLLLLSMILVAPPTYAEEAKIWTDKEDYSPTEAVTIFGWGFQPLADVTVIMGKPDETIDTVYAVTNDVGGFVCTYQLDGMEGIYTVTATDGTNTASTTFSEAKPTFSITIDTVNGYSPPFPTFTNPIHLAGRANSTNFPGHLYQYQVQVDWGDGTVDPDSNVNFTQYGDDFNGTWSSSPDHNYATGGNYTITVKLYHQQPPGAESGDAQAQITITVAPPTANIIVTTSPSGLSIVVDSVTYTAPQNFSWVIGSTHSIGTTSPQPGLTGVQYVWTSWSDGGTIIHNIIVPSTPTTYTAYFKTQCWVSFTQSGSAVPPTVDYIGDTDPTGTVPFGVWVKNGSWISYAYQAIVPGASGVRYVLTGVTPVSPQMVNGPMTILGTYKAQYEITVTASPAGAVGGTFDVTYTQCGTTYTNVQKTTTWTEWVDANTDVTVSSPEDPIYDGPDTRYTFDHYDPSASVTMTGPTTITLVYTTQYYLTVVSQYDTPSGEGWYDECTYANADLATGIVDIVPGWVRAVFTGWSGDASGTGLISNPIHMDSPKTAIANWTIQYYLDVVTDPSHLPPIPGAEWYDNCTWVRLTAPQYVPSEAGEDGVRYVFSYWDVDGASQGIGVNPIDIHMNEPHIATAHYTTQYYLTVQTDPLGLVTIPGEGWYDKCTYVDLEAPGYVYVSGDTRYRFDHWDVDTVTAPGNPIDVHMDAPHTATAHYVKQYYLTVRTDPLGLVTIPGEGWYDECTHVTLTAPPLVPISPGVRYRFDHWDVDTVTAPGNPIDVHMDAPHTATAHYVKQYYLTVTDNIGGLSDVSTQSGWYDGCTYVPLMAPPLVLVSPGVRYRFDYWDVDTTIVPGNPITVHMDAPHTATAHYVKQYYLTVKTDPEGLNPVPIGEGWYDECTTVDIMAPPVSYLDHNEYVFVYWDIDSSILTSEDLIHVHMDIPHTVTAHYWLPRPRHLDAEPPLLINLSEPVCTQWDELYPEYSRSYHLQSWYDTNLDGRLTPSDYIDLWDKDHQWKVRPYFWHVDDITVTLKVYEINTKETMYIELKDGWVRYERVIKLPKGTQWHEVYPNYSRQYYLEKWYDNCNAKLSYCDRIILRDEATGEQAEYHVLEAKTDLIISPQATHIILCEMKDNVGQHYSQIICETIHNYYGTTTAFTLCAYYNGLQPIGNQTLILNPLESGNAIVEWTETSTWPKGTYSFTITIKTYVNDTLVYSTSFAIQFKITIVGDTNGDEIVDIEDIYTAALAYGTSLCEPQWHPNCDVNNDMIVDIEDIYLIAVHFGDTDP